MISILKSKTFSVARKRFSFSFLNFFTIIFLSLIFIKTNHLNKLLTNLFITYEK